VGTNSQTADEKTEPAVLEVSQEAAADMESTRVDPFFAAGCLWAVGMAFMAGYGMFSFLRMKGKLQEAVRVSENVYICDAVSSPFILGMIRPRIYLPSGLNERLWNYVLAHEKAHLKRRDHWWKPLGYLLLCVYWFHPLMWLAYVLMCRDIELACDERAVRSMDFDERKAYSKALVSCSTRRRMVIACPLAFGEVDVKERVKSVLAYKKPAFWVILAAAFACAAVAVCFLTSQKPDAEPEEVIAGQKEELTQKIGTIYSRAEATRYTITDWELVVDSIEGERADCTFCANWIAARATEEDPLILGMQDAVSKLTDQDRKKEAEEIVDGWIAELQSQPTEETIGEPIVILLENQEPVLYYSYVEDGEETLIPLQEYADSYCTEDAKARFDEGVSIIEEALGTSDLPGSLDET
jgi:hypothetical protein